MAAPGNTTANRDGFSSKLGFILACVGSAVGMGNIWLFLSAWPRMAALSF